MQTTSLAFYQNYRKFLLDYYLTKKNINKNFSYRRFAQLAEIKSSNYLMLVMQGKRRLSMATARKVAKAMKLSSLETDYFLLLVQNDLFPNQAESIEKSKNALLKKLTSKQIPKDKTDFFQKWHHSLVRELVFLKSFKADGDWISKKLRSLISADEALQSLELLLRLKMIKKENNKWVVQENFIDSGPDGHLFENISILSIHKAMFQNWIKILDHIPVQERELGLVNIPISAERIPELKKRIKDFQDEIIGWLENETEATTVVQLGTYLVPITTKCI